MMTSDERREVAARLRERPVARNIKEAYVAIVQAVGVRPCLLSHEGESGDRFDAVAYALALDRLADLIEPEPERTCHNVYELNRLHYTTIGLLVEGCENGFECSECGEVVEDDDCNHVSGTWNYCPNCGARVVSD